MKMFPRAIDGKSAAEHAEFNSAVVTRGPPSLEANLNWWIPPAMVVMMPVDASTRRMRAMPPVPPVPPPPPPLRCDARLGNIKVIPRIELHVAGAAELCGGGEPSIASGTTAGYRRDHSRVPVHPAD